MAIRGLPPQVVTGPRCDAEAVWRGGLLARGSLSEPGKTRALGISCGGGEPALTLALLGAARRLHVSAHVREVGDSAQVTVSDRDTITALLTRLGAPVTAHTWAERRARQETRVAAARAARTCPDGWDAANLTRSVLAARASAERAARALQVLGPTAPPHLAAVARLRIAHPEASLERLGALCDPPLSKDTIAGRLRRLCVHADTQAAQPAGGGVAAVVGPVAAGAAPGKGGEHDARR